MRVKGNKDPVPPRWKWIATAAMVVIVPVVVVALTKLSTPSTPSTSVNPVTRSIAVLPLLNISNNAELKDFMNDMTETLTTSLSQIRAFNVTAPTLAMRYRGTTKTIQEIGRELRVDAIVEGAAQLSGGRVAITARLVDAASGRNLWTKSYERELRDLSSLQSDLAQTIAQEIQAKLTSKEQTGDHH